MQKSLVWDFFAHMITPLNIIISHILSDWLNCVDKHQGSRECEAAKLNPRAPVSRGHSSQFSSEMQVRFDNAQVHEQNGALASDYVSFCW